MRALIRNPGETIHEEMGIEGIDWNTGRPLTLKDWSGGPYTLIQGYTVPGKDDIVSTPDQYEEIIVEQEPKAETEPEATVVIDGKTYTVSQLKQLLGE